MSKEYKIMTDFKVSFINTEEAPNNFHKSLSACFKKAAYA